MLSLNLNLSLNVKLLFFFFFWVLVLSRKPFILLFLRKCFLTSNFSADNVGVRPSLKIVDLFCFDIIRLSKLQLCDWNSNDCLCFSRWSHIKALQRWVAVLFVIAGLVPTTWGGVNYPFKSQPSLSIFLTLQ